MDSLTLVGDEIEFDREEDITIGGENATDIEWDLRDEFEIGAGAVALEDANAIELDLDAICSELRLKDPDLWILLLLFALKNQNMMYHTWV